MRPIAIRQALLVAAAAMALTFTPAGARERFAIHGEHVDAPYIQPFYDDGGPALVNGGVAYVDEPGRRAHVVFRPPGGPSRRLAQFEPVLRPTPPKGLAGYIELVGHGRRLVLARNEDDPRFGGKQGGGAVVASKVDGGGIRTLARCKRGISWGPRMGSSAVMLLSTPPGRDCKGDLRYRIFSLVSDTVFTLPFEETMSDPKLGGHYAIWNYFVSTGGLDDEPRGTVYDLRARRAVQRSRKFDPLAIGDDGTLVASRFSNGPCQQLSTYDVEDPHPRTLPYRTCLPYLTQVAGQRIVFIGRPPGAGAFSDRAWLMLGDTSGSPPIRLSDEFALLDYPGFDFDGERIAYRLYRCSGARVLAVDEVATAISEGPMHIGKCSADIEAPDHPVDLRQGFDVALTCPNGCAGRMYVRGPNRTWRLRTNASSPFKRGRHLLHVRVPSAPAAGEKTDPATLRFDVWQPNGETTTYKRAIDIRRPGG